MPNCIASQCRSNIHPERDFSPEIDRQFPRLQLWRGLYNSNSVQATVPGWLLGGGAMASELRKTGIDVVGDMPWGAHFCYFYETKQDLLDILIPYFKTGLENREFCLWVISNS